MKHNRRWTLRSLLTVFFVLSSLHPIPAGAVPPVSFGPQANYGTGSRPNGVAVADFDRDGKLDVVTANYWASTVSILLGNGDGTFMAHADFGTYQSAATFVATGDFNGDGKPDLVAAGRYTNYVSVLLGNGDGTFAGHVEYGVGSDAHNVAVGDLNGDGRLDLAVTNGISNSVSVLLGNGDGTFGAKTDFAVVTPYAIAIGDLNADGRPDLVTGSWGGNTVSVLLGAGGGIFGPSTDFASGTYPYSLAIADLNGDGRLDVVTGNYYSGAASVLLGRGDGTFAAKVDLATGTNPVGVTAGDFNGDGALDLAVANATSNTVSVLLGNGDGTFEPKMDFGSGSSFAWIATGDFDRDGKPDLVVTDFYSDQLAAWLNTTTGSTIAPQPPTTSITPSHPCVQVPVTIANRPDATPVRGFSVTVRLSGNLALCPPRIMEGDYLGSIGTTIFQTIDNGGGSYTVDCAILGVPCGATAPSGTLFTLHLGSAAATGTGTVTVTGASLADCNNGRVESYPGPPASITIDNEVPVTVVLAAAQRMAGNDADGTTRIDLSWTGTVVSGDSVIIYRAGYGHYPEYDMGGSVPGTPNYPPASPWARAGHVVAAGTSFVDEVAARDFWYYVAFVKDPNGNVSGVSNKTGGTLNYFLGDVHDGSKKREGNNRVWAEDISFLGAHYGITLADPDLLGCLDVGPTTDGSVNGRPAPDDKVNFKDLILFAINYEQVSLPQAAAVPVAAGRDELSLEAPVKVSAGETFAVTLHLEGAGGLQGISTQLGWDAAVAEPLSVEAGALVATLGGVVLSSGPGTVDAALLGPGRTFAGDGTLATVTFRARASGDPKVAIEKVDARDAMNRAVALAGVQPQTPRATAFAPVTPNPFARTATLSFSLAQGGPVELAIFSVDGRRVRTLVNEAREAGTYRLSWDGADEAGRAVSPGLFYARLMTPQGRFNRTLVMVK